MATAPLSFSQPVSRNSTSQDQPSAADTPQTAAARFGRPDAIEQRRKAIWVVWVIAAVVVMTMVTDSFAQAPKYKVLPVNPALEEPSTYKKMENAAKAVSQARNLADVGRDNGRMAAFYFQNYVPAKITQPDSVTKISELMGNVGSRMSASERSKVPGAPLIKKWLYNGLSPVAKGNFQPPARIAAILFISRMDTAPADRAKQTPPVPLANIPGDFLPIYQDKTAPEGVRAAALQGLHRYTIYAAPALRDPLRSTLVGEMQQLLDSEPPEGRTADVHAYLQRFAVDILASLRGATDADLGKRLISLSTTTKKHDLIALHSAALLGSMANDLRGNVESTTNVLDSWTVRAMRSFQYEIARINAFERPKPVPGQPRAPDSLAAVKTNETKPKASSMGGRSGGMGMDDMDMNDMGMDDMMMDDMGMGMDDMDMDMGMGMGFGMGGVVQANPQPPEVIISRRKLNFVLQQLHKGVNGSGTVGEPRVPGGLLAAVEEADQQVVKDWLEKMEAVVTALNEPTLDTLEKYSEALDVQVTMLEEIAGPEAVAAAADEPILLPGVSRMVAVKPMEKEATPDAPVLDESGAPTFPENLDELAAPE